MNKIDILYQKWQSLQPLPERKQYLLSQRFTVDYNYNSNHIEGNTLTYGQTELLLLFGKVSGEGDLKDFNDMKASQVSLKMIEEEAKNLNMPLTETFIRQLHKTLLREDYEVHNQLPGGIQTSYTVHAGRYKTRPNSVRTRYGDYFEYASPEETPALMSDLVTWFNKEEASGVLTPVELASLFHYRYIRIHPFEDGNGRVARLMVNYVVVGSTPSAGAHAKISQIKRFAKYFNGLVEKELKYYIDFATETSEKVWWYDGSKIVFRSESSNKLLHAMQENPYITTEELSKEADIVVTAVKKQLRAMIEKGYIQRRDNDNSWHVFATSSI